MKYFFTDHILQEAMIARGLSRDDILEVMSHGSTWRHFDYSMRTRKDDLIVCWEDDGERINLITVFDVTNRTLSDGSQG